MSKRDEAIRNFAIWDLKRNRDYYPAGAIDPEGCFYNGQIGDCNTGCPQFLRGGCPVEDEVKENENA